MKTYTDFGINTRGKSSGELQTICPKCSHTRKKKTSPCLSVNLGKGCWVCHHCDWRGSLKAGEESQSKPEQWRIKTCRKPEYQEPQGLPERALKYLAGERGIPPHVLKRNRIGFGKIWMPQIEDYTDAFQFPYVKGGEVVNVKYRDFEKNFRQEAGAEKTFFKFDDISDECTIITEGEIDALSCEAAGFANAVSVPDGAPAENTKEYSSKFSYLENCKDRLDTVKKFVLAVDNDAPGRKLEEELSRRLGRERCYRVTWPAGIKDANECLTKLGAEALKEVIEKAQPYPVQGLFQVIDFADKVLDLYDMGFKGGLSTGWKNLDEKFTVLSGEMTITTGIPSHGKSAVIDNLIVNLARLHGWKAGVFSPEHYPIETHIAKFAEIYSGKPFAEKFSGRMNSKELMAAMNWVNDHIKFLLPDENALGVHSVLDLAKACVFRHGIKVLAIDPWNTLDHARPERQSETEYISDCLERIRRFARNHDCHVFLIVHPMKLPKENGKYQVPRPYDISGSAHWYNKSDNILTVWRDVAKNISERSSETEIHVQKVKQKRVGQLGMAKIYYDYPTSTYSDIETRRVG